MANQWTERARQFEREAALQERLASEEERDGRIRGADYHWLRASLARENAQAAWELARKAEK